MLNTWHYSVAPRTMCPLLDVVRRKTGFAEVVGDLNEDNAAIDALPECEDLWAAQPRIWGKRRFTLSQLRRMKRAVNTRAKGVEAMALQEMFAQQLETQIKEWEKQTGDFKAKVEKAGTQVRAEYEKNLKALENKTDQAAKMLSQVQQVNEAAWKDMEASTTRAFEELKKGWEEAIARYK